MPEQKLIEQKFQEFKEKQASKDFQDVAFLEHQADLIRPKDAELADRIMHRVRNLNKQADKERDSGSRAVGSQSVVNAGKETESTNKKAVSEPKSQTWRQIVQVKIKTPFVVFVVVPTLLFAFYQLLWATERYESQAQVIVQQPDSAATMDSSLALLSGLGVSTTSSADPQLLETYINSNDMLNYLDQTLDLKKYYSEPEADIFSRLKADATQEDFLEFYQKHITVEIDEKSGVISISVQSFDPQFAQKLAEQIVSRSEWYINNIGHQLAEAQLSFIKVEHQLDEDKLKKAQVTLLNFQQKYHLLDPSAEGVAMQQIAYGIEGQIATKEAELKSLTNIMSEHAPQVKASRNDLEALRKQLLNERNKLAQDGGQAIPVSEILAKYTDLRVAMEIALQSYTSSKISLEKSRIEAYRQLKYLITVQSATKPEQSTYPDAFYNISLFFILAAMIFAIIRIIYAVVHELK
jgi:capsular polysaccharide transport system permease protein